MTLDRNPQDQDRAQDDAAAQDAGTGTGFILVNDDGTTAAPANDGAKASASTALATYDAPKPPAQNAGPAGASAEQDAEAAKKAFFVAFARDNDIGQKYTDQDIERVYDFMKERNPEALEGMIDVMAAAKSGAVDAALLEASERIVHMIQRGLTLTRQNPSPAPQAADIVVAADVDAHTGPTLDLTAHDPEKAPKVEKPEAQETAQDGPSQESVRFIGEWYKKYMGRTLTTEQSVFVADSLRQVNPMLYDYTATAIPPYGKVGPRDEMGPQDKAILAHHYTHVEPERLGALMAGQPIAKGGVISALGKIATSPVTVGIAAGAGMRLASNTVLSGVLLAGGPIGLIAAGAAGVVNGATVELIRLRMQASAAQKSDPALADLSIKEAMQHVLKQKEKQKLQSKIARIDKAILKADGDTAKIHDKESQKIELVAKLERLENKPLAEISIGSHVLKAGLLAGAASAASFGLIPHIADAFNYVAPGATDWIKDTAHSLVTTIGNHIPGLGGHTAPVITADAVGAGGGIGSDTVAAPVDVAPVVAALDPATGLNLTNATPDMLALADQMREAGVRVMPLADIDDALAQQFGGADKIPARYAPFIERLESGSAAVRAEAAHSIAYMLIENNAELGKAGHRTLATSIMLSNVMEHGRDSGLSGLERSWDGLRWLNRDVAGAVGKLNNVELADIRSFAPTGGTGIASQFAERGGAVRSEVIRVADLGSGTRPRPDLLNGIY